MGIAETFEYLVNEILMGFPFKQRPRLKPGPRGRQVLDGMKEVACASGSEIDASWKDAAGQYVVHEDACSIPANFIVARMFVCEARLLRSSHSVTQSTTEAVTGQSESHYCRFRGINPRRLPDPGV